MSIQQSRVDKRASIARALAKEGFSDVYVIDHESANEVLTSKRVELLEHLREVGASSVRDLAESIGRDKASVSRDLATLAKHDLIEYQKEGSRKIPIVKHDTVIVEPVI